MNCLEEGYPTAKQSRHSEDNNSLKQFEIEWLLTESSNQLLTEIEDEVAISSAGSSSEIMKTG